MFVPPFYLADYITFRKTKNLRCFYKMKKLLLLAYFPLLKSKCALCVAASDTMGSSTLWPCCRSLPSSYCLAEPFSVFSPSRCATRGIIIVVGCVFGSLVIVHLR